MRHELLFLVVSIILVLQIPLQPYYVLVYNKEITSEISKTLKLVQLCIAVLFVWGRHCVFFRRPSYSMQDIYLMLFIVSCYFSKSLDLNRSNSNSNPVTCNLIVDVITLSSELDEILDYLDLILLLDILKLYIIYS